MLNFRHWGVVRVDWGRLPAEPAPRGAMHRLWGQRLPAGPPLVVQEEARGQPRVALEPQPEVQGDPVEVREERLAPQLRHWRR